MLIYMLYCCHERPIIHERPGADAHAHHCVPVFCLRVLFPFQHPSKTQQQTTKSPGSRGSVVSIGSVCGAAAFTPLQQAAGGSGEHLEAGKYTPTMKLDFGGVGTREQAAVCRQAGGGLRLIGRGMHAVGC